MSLALGSFAPGLHPPHAPAQSVPLRFDLGSAARIESAERAAAGQPRPVEIFPLDCNLIIHKEESMNRVLSSAVVVAGLVFTLGGEASWGQVPPTNDTKSNLRRLAQRCTR